MIAFMSDWGYDSYYVGVAKAVIRSITKEEIIDITQQYRPLQHQDGSPYLTQSVYRFSKGHNFFVCS